MLDAFGIARTRQDGTHHKGSESHGEAAVDREHGHAEAQTHRHHEKRLAVEEATDTAEQRRQHIHSHQEPHDKEEHQLADA